MAVECGSLLCIFDKTGGFLAVVIAIFPCNLGFRSMPTHVTSASTRKGTQNYGYRDGADRCNADALYACTRMIIQSDTI